MLSIVGSILIFNICSVYCLELCRTASGQQHIITGSRDRTIKMWSLKTGRCLGTFGGNTGDVDGHRGSVLCLKFFWENDGRNGVLYSGSSDCTVCVWDVWIVKPSRSRHFDDSDEGIEVQARIKTVLRGHNGGVLDLRVDANWIVSWYVGFASYHTVVNALAARRTPSFVCGAVTRWSCIELFVVTRVLLMLYASRAANWSVLVATER